MKKLVIIPTYNEKENIENIISAVFALKEDFHVLIVDDSSPDGTAEIVKNLQKIYRNMKRRLLQLYCQVQENIKQQDRPTMLSDEKIGL